MPTRSTPTPLPYPAEEIRSSALDFLAATANEMQRLLIFFRGHQKSTHVLESVTLRILSIEISLHHLRWDATNCEPPFDAPTAPPPPTPEPQKPTPSAPN